MTWTDDLAAANRTEGRAVIAHLHPGEVSASFSESLLGLVLYDQSHHSRLFHPQPQGARFGYASVACGAGRIADGRNQAVSRFLTIYPDAEWLLCIDSDMGFDPDTLERLIASADPETRPVVGGLCFAAKYAGHAEQHAALTNWVPTIYQRTPEGTYTASYEYPPDRVVEVGASGAACLLIHRGVLERMQADYGPTWFDNRCTDRGWLGEDFSFCDRLREMQVPVHVDTGVRTSHHKDVWFTEADYRLSRCPASTAVSVVIPVKDNLELTRSLVSQLYSQGGYSDILIFDNGSETPEMRAWLEGQQVASVFDASGRSIHEMWNAGIAEAHTRHRGRADVVFLNNDLNIAPRFLRHLITGLHADPALMAVSGNYDGRPGTGVMPTRGICARRYDGTGGFGGFAFAVKAEWVASGYRFPESLRWWYGDNDLTLSIEKAGGWYGIALDAGVEHLDDASRAPMPESMAAEVERDREVFAELWPTVELHEVPAAFTAA